MVDIAQGALFILACAFLCGLRVFLFRDQQRAASIWSSALDAEIAQRLGGV
jgi:hypothetical protein